MREIIVGVAVSIVALAVLLAGGGIGFLALMKPRHRPPSAEKVELTSERIARGRYLAEHVVGCFGCHSEYAFDLYTFPWKEGTKGVGGFCFDKENAGFPGRACAQNITQDHDTGLGAWTDGEILRAIREGVNRHGDALFPMMPYPYLRHLSDEDARSIVAYLRTIPPVRKETPKGHVDFPVNLFIKLAPQPLDGPVPHPDRADTVAWGKYLATLACVECHTPVDENMNPIPGREYAGGREFDLSRIVPGFKVRSANLTPDPTGIGPKSRENFIAQFKAFADTARYRVKVAPEHNTLMPWLQFAQLTEEDLGAVYDYLRTLPPLRNAVERRPAPRFPAAVAD